VLGDSANPKLEAEDSEPRGFAKNLIYREQLLLPLCESRTGKRCYLFDSYIKSSWPS